METAVRQIALFGGSFNPPHVGHLLACAYVQAVAKVDAVWLLPAMRHPFGKKLVPFDERLALCRALAGHLRGVEACSIEAEPGLDGRTIHTVERLRQQHPGCEFSLVVGADIVQQWSQWFEFERLSRLVRPIVLGRTGYPQERPAEGPLSDALFLTDVRLPEVSSTDVRDRLASGQPVEHLVPALVLQEIRVRGLYRGGTNS